MIEIDYHQHVINQLSSISESLQNLVQLFTVVVGSGRQTFLEFNLDDFPFIEEE